MPRPTNAQIDAHLTAIVHSATFTVVKQYHDLGLRSRILTLPVMVALLVALVWRQVPGVRPLARLLTRESVLWIPPTRVSHQAINVRLRTLPPDLVAAVVRQILPQLAARAAARNHPQPPLFTRTREQFAHIWAVDATVLEALFKKVGPLRGTPQTVLGGQLLGMLDVVTRLPVHLVWDAEPSINERRQLDPLLAQVPPNTLLLLDKGFFGFAFFDWCTEHGIAFIVPDRTTTAVRESDVLQQRGPLVDEQLRLGRYRSNPCRHPVRRITLQVGSQTYRYLTNVLDPEQLPAPDVIALYRQRWRIEEAFLLTKRLLGLSYLWTGAANGIALQVWATWLLYAILVDLADAIAAEVDLPLHRISLEMVFRSLYFYVGAVSQGETLDPVAYLTHPDQRDLGIIKRPRGPTALDTVLRSLI